MKVIAVEPIECYNVKVETDTAWAVFQRTDSDLQHGYPMRWSCLYLEGRWPDSDADLEAAYQEFKAKENK